ncbi:MAG: type IX secretion system protein PorQ [Bacteroidetes bacterium]|nr:type IX secretion system protein PorQ [Bacteroidota bacterium]
MRISRFLLFLLPLSLSAQGGASGVFAPLSMPINARQAAWGGYCNSYRSQDPTFGLVNPALLNAGMHNRVAMNFNTQVKGVWSGNGAYARHWEKLGTLALNVAHINYGTMNAYDAAGNPEGTVSANETVLGLSVGREIAPNLHVGGGLKMTYSILGPYIGAGVAADVGMVWHNRDSVISVGAVLRNAGFMVLAYNRGNGDKLPFSAEAGVNFKPKHMPFRFNITAHNLQKWDLTYNQYLQTNQTIDLSGKPVTPAEAKFGDKLMRHFAVGTELVLGKNFGVLGGYNHQRRREMAPDVRPGLSGFSWGLMFRVSRIQITYSSSTFFPGFNANLFTFAATLSEFRRKPASSRS